MAESLLSHRDVLPPGAAIHLARARLATTRPRGLHGHDFFELFWVQNGQVREHLDGAVRDLSEGTLVFLRPGDRHALQGRGEDALVVSVTLHPEVIAGLGLRHPRLVGHLFWAAGPRAECVARDPRQMAEINRAALRLERGAVDALGAEGFVLPLVAGLVEDRLPLPAGAPDWLARACAAAADPGVFREGAAGFARVAGRAHAHVSRTVRRYLDLSPSDYVNARRMEFAARRLAGSTDTLAEIAADCGIPNLSHFHKLFRSHHGTTPRRYRQMHQADVVQPG